MSDVIVRVGLDEPSQESQLTLAIDAFARWREDACDADCADNDAPDIMVKTNWDATGQVHKTLIFQDRKWAAAFLRFWRDQKRSAD